MKYFGSILPPVRPGEHGAHAASSISVDASEASASSPSTGASAPGAHAAPPRPGEPEVYDSLPASPLYKESAAIFETSVMAAADLPDHADGR